MTGALTALAAFLAGVLVGLEAPVLVPALLRRHRAREPNAERVAPEDGVIGNLAQKVSELKEILEGVQWDLNRLSEKVSRLDLAASSNPARGNLAPGAHRARTADEPGRPRAVPMEGSFRRDPFDRQPLLPLQREESAPSTSSGASLGFEPASAPGEWDQWQTSPSPAAGPPANAINVEARDDRIVTTSSFPPEAWLEVVAGTAEGRVTLNPAVRLNDYALQRLSTFFEWEGRRADATYHTERPASVKWDDGARVGVLVSRGRARAR